MDIMDIMLLYVNKYSVLPVPVKNRRENVNGNKNGIKVTYRCENYNFHGFIMCMDLSQKLKYVILPEN